MKNIQGVHHLTAITNDAQKNIRFYRDLLGLRLIKLTVNFDDPSAYHLYYGDNVGTPGTILTYFVWKDIPQGESGLHQINTMLFKIPAGSLAYWKKRISGAKIKCYEMPEYYKAHHIVFRDYDNLEVALIEAKKVDEIKYWKGSSVPEKNFIQGIHGVRMEVPELKPTKKAIMAVIEGVEDWKNYHISQFSVGNAIIVVNSGPSLVVGYNAGGTVHHVAWRVADDLTELKVRKNIAAHGLKPTEVIDRTYFHSVYFREPGGVLFEIATDTPGFTIDETAAKLGSSLKLPPHFEPYRKEIVKMLPKIPVAI